ncbi:MAG TPA: Uma2 family endonuclease [Candidatus Cybelea sp.]|jgi:Uma2 family endonuclease|nr:Uma2 family endonuclease [Candidatus Cybelea sp.]
MENLALHLFNLKEYYRMAEIGMLPENASVELLNCQILDKSDGKPHRFSIKDYYRLAEEGVLRPDARVELLDGSIIDMSPIGPLHAGSVRRLIRLFNDSSKDRWLLSVHNPVHLDDHSELQPDLMLLRPFADDYCSRHPVPEDVFLLVEVSDSTLDSDRDLKLPVYARTGIVEVWIVDLNNGALEVYRELHLTGYTNIRILHDGDFAAPASFPDAVIEVSKLLRH